MATEPGVELLPDETRASEGSPSQSASPVKEPFVGNVSKCTPLPPNHSGTARKGHLQFDACFETGTVTAHSSLAQWSGQALHSTIDKRHST